MNSTLASQPPHDGSGITERFVVFAVDHQRYALPLAEVERVVSVVEITPLPEAQAFVHGLINLHGRIIPVLDCRERFGLPARELALSDQLLIAQIARRTAALLVDRVEGVIEPGVEEMAPAAQILPAMRAHGAMKLPNGGMVLLPDFDAFLSPEDERQLGQAMNTL